MAVDSARSESTRLLAWYDVHARSLPWRAPPGAPLADPYRVWLSEIMLQQTTVAAVGGYFATFTRRWPTVEALAAAPDDEVMAAWAGLGYYARARNLLACARIVAAEHGGRFPDTEERLRALPGIGAYTAAAIAAIAFGRRAVVVDGNIERLVSRLFAVEEPLPAAKPRLRALMDGLTPETRAGDFAQAMMDLGATICAPRSPKCLLCPIAEGCAARAMGEPAAFPKKAVKATRPHRYGTAFWAERDGCVLLRRRPNKGLLGGMRALPTGPWVEAPPGIKGAPVPGDWRVLDGQVRHVFTHFSLDLALARASDLSPSPPLSGDEWWPIDRLDEAGLPTVFAKAAAGIREGV
ncbi:A/G-specific adenine glycosylase [Sphingomonas sp. ID0503]|uniref:A/G-specific adenine glycosylase n=1 Tax=Sphingomonas sp. ID0503 TaxID=3399691 RepID=UPI003AFB417D